MTVIHGAFRREAVMRRVLLALIAAASLAGCAGIYDEQARDQCDTSSRASDRGACYDRVDQNRREREGRQ